MQDFELRIYNNGDFNTLVNFVACIQDYERTKYPKLKEGKVIGNIMLK